MRRLACLLALVSVTATACFGANGAELSPSGKGLPTVTVDFAAEAPPGSTQTATFEIGNPGPGDMGRLELAFAPVGVGGADPVPDPLVTAESRGVRAVTNVEPSPLEVAGDGVLYSFPGLAEGETTTITFELRLPETPGTVANSVTVYDAFEPERGRGVRLLTVVEE